MHMPLSELYQHSFSKNNKYEHMTHLAMNADSSILLGLRPRHGKVEMMLAGYMQDLSTNLHNVEGIRG
jgi:hypothetical protein